MGASLPVEAIAHQQHPLARWRRVSAISGTSSLLVSFSCFVYLHFDIFVLLGPLNPFIDTVL